MVFDIMVNMTNIINVRKGMVLRLENAPGRSPVRLRTGSAWVTLANCERDFLLAAGDFLPAGAGMVVEALTDLVLLQGGNVLAFPPGGVPGSLGARSG